MSPSIGDTEMDIKNVFVVRTGYVGNGIAQVAF